jgi:hypothetical protein
MADQWRINNNIYSWASIICKIDDERYYGFTKLSYGDKRERTKVYGMARHYAPRARTHGKYTIEPVKLGGPKSSCQALRAGLAARAPDQISYGDVEFQIVTQYVEADEQSLTVVIERCVIIGNASDESEDPKHLEEDIEIDAMLIRRNGLTLFDSQEGQP